MSSPEQYPLSYWLGLLRSDLRWYGRQRRYRAMCRAMWRVIWHRDNVQVCQDCGRRYVVWMAPDEMYVKVHGSRGGCHCPACFGERAKALGLWIIWVPMYQSDELAETIGAFQEPVTHE